MQPGMTAWDVRRGPMGSTTAKTTRIYSVKIVSVDLDAMTVVASWNFNAAQKVRKPVWSKWKAVKPVLVGNVSQRLATKAEIAAMRDGQ